MKQLPRLKPGDSVEMIAPASRCSFERCMDLKALLESWQLRCVFDEATFGDDLLCANTDENRLKFLRNALQRSESKAIICLRGGYGSMRLIPALNTMIPPSTPKWFVGMSDITALHLFLGQQWQWPTLHGSLAREIVSAESILAVKALLFGEVDQIERRGVPLNDAAKQTIRIDASLTGGNLSMVQASIGTSWQMDSRNKFILLEEIGERGYRIDRMLEQLKQASLFKEASAIIFADCIQGNEPNGSSLINPVIERFAQTCDIPVVRIEGVGHGDINFPLPLGTEAGLFLGTESKLVCASL
jgi:muramoyltetrapeptide carboxypeptidase